jgi:membrane-associated phospholipid phosphatase
LFRPSELRPPEWLILAYFSYVALAASWWFRPGTVRISGKAWALAGVVAAVISILSKIEGKTRGKTGGKTGRLLRDFAPLAFLLAAYREMDWFTPAVRDHHLEHAWIVWDRWLLDQGHLRATIESAGPLLPSYLEFCYLLVYGVGPVSLGLLFLNGQRAQVSRFWLAYLAGTLGAYSLLPYFPSEPPRIAFPGADLPQVSTWLRQINLWILGGYGIHSSVFPSAHVSSAFSAAWALRATIPERAWIGWGFALYAVCVTTATVYGRYHYAVDALAGLAVSLLALPSLILSRPRPSQ